MYITIFRSRLWPEHTEEYGPIAEEMRALAESMPGFVAFKTYAGQDDERVAIAEFADEASHNAWRDHPRHREAQQLGREKFYSEFRVQVCTLVREGSMTAHR